MWTSSQKGGSQYVVSTIGTTITSDRTLWAEYTNLGNNECTLTLSVISTLTGKELFTEELIYRPFKSITAAFVGESSIPGNVKNTPAVNTWVTQELLNGYDVHVWDDGHAWFSWDDCDEWGNGPALDEIANSINNRGVTNVALLGYSHGGGTVYNLSKRLYYDGRSCEWYDKKVTFPDVIDNNKSYNIVFTTYIDAIRNDRFTRTLPEKNRPLGSKYHVNQFQRNTKEWETSGWPFKLNGTHSNALGEIDEDRSSWTDQDGNLLNHLTIGINEGVWQIITSAFEKKVSR
jgi:hypothetical protein